MNAENLRAKEILISIIGDHKSLGAREMLAREVLHARDVLRWLKIINPNASTELQSAALLHDCERLTDRGEKHSGFKGERNTESYFEHKRHHTARSADLTRAKLTERGVDVQKIERVCWLISHHDDTGEEVTVLNDKELNELVAADTFSFFTSIAREMLDREGQKRVEDKVRFMIGKTPAYLRTILAQAELPDKEIEKIKTDILFELS